MSNRLRYPFHKSLNYVLASVESPLYAMRLIRTIAFNLDVSTDQVEILIGLAAQKDAVDIIKVYDFVPHLKPRRVLTLLKKLIDIKAVQVLGNYTDLYMIGLGLAIKIKSLDKESLKLGIY